MHNNVLTAARLPLTPDPVYLQKMRTKNKRFRLRRKITHPCRYPEVVVKQTFYARVPVIPLRFPVWLYGLSQSRLKVISCQEVGKSHEKTTRLHSNLA